MRKKELNNHLKELQIRYATLQTQNYAIIEILKASGIIELLKDNEDIVGIATSGLFGTKEFYKINEVF